MYHWHLFAKVTNLYNYVKSLYKNVSDELHAYIEVVVKTRHPQTYHLLKKIVTVSANFVHTLTTALTKVLGIFKKLLTGVKHILRDCCKALKRKPGTPTLWEVMTNNPEQIVDSLCKPRYIFTLTSLIYVFEVLPTLTRLDKLSLWGKLNHINGSSVIYMCLLLIAACITNLELLIQDDSENKKLTVGAPVLMSLYAPLPPNPLQLLHRWSTDFSNPKITDTLTGNEILLLTELPYEIVAMQLIALLFALRIQETRKELYKYKFC